MAVQIHDDFKAAPRISEDRFVSVLESVGSFDSDALWDPTPRDKRPDEARSLYRLIASQGHDPAAWLAVAGKEHTFGINRQSVLWRNYTHSWTNARTVRHPLVKARAETIKDPLRGSNYVRYRDVYDSVLDGLYRVDEPGFDYRKANAKSIVDHIRIWAPSKDNNKPEQYAQTMCDWINQWIATDPVRPGTRPPLAGPISGLIDIRDKLATASGANRGPLRTIPMSQKRGVVIHYRGVVTTPVPGYSTFQSDATYHVNKDWGGGSRGDGIQYHIGIGWDGNAYWMRDLDRVLWHCGAWPQNENTLAIQLPMGGNQQATPEMLATLRRVVDEWLAYTKAPRSEVRGHQELSGTSCPGTLMSTFVYPYRNREDQPMADGHYFGETQRFLGGGFWHFWRDRGGLPIFGYPLTDELDEVCEDGKVHTVQYFERAVFEFHPANKPPYDILLRRLGADALKGREAA